MLQEDPVEVDAASDEQNGNGEDGRTEDEMKTTGTHLQTKTTQMIFRADLFQVKNRRHRRDRMIQRRKVLSTSHVVKVPERKFQKMSTNCKAQLETSRTSTR
jgi:hypothetical protein